ncbi:MAG: DUF4339 domain-containing protein [Verrucomicrobiae bacterium]|nr:DUF4339 domain-containing protein [Verrucomicrobiae bacterium]
MPRLILTLVLIPLTLVLITALSALYFGWWGVAAVAVVLVGVVFAGVLAVRFFFRATVKSFEKAFEARASVLSGAEVQIHAVEYAEVTPSSGDDGEGLAACWMEVTLSPVETDTPFKLWEPDSLTLTGAVAPDLERGGDTREDGEPVSGWVEEWQVFRDGKFVKDPEAEKLEGCQRLRLRVNFDRRPGGPVVFEYGPVRVGMEFILPESVFDIAAQAEKLGIQVAEFYLMEGDLRIGPLTLDEIQRKLDRGEITGENLVWHDNLGDWTPLSRIVVPGPGPRT